MSNSGWITFFGCISDSLQPLTVHCHWLWSVQPIYSGICNTAKSCTQYSQNICSVARQSAKELISWIFGKWKMIYFTIKTLNFKTHYCFNILQISQKLTPKPKIALKSPAPYFFFSLLFCHFLMKNQSISQKCDFQSRKVYLKINSTSPKHKHEPLWLA